MRTIARGLTPEKCKQRVDMMVKDGWKQISDIKVDPSPYIDINYVCVMEKPDTENDKRKRVWKGNNFGRGYSK